jgi:hypothetical protein
LPAARVKADTGVATGTTRSTVLKALNFRLKPLSSCLPPRDQE